MKNTLQQVCRRKSALLVAAGIITLAVITGSTSAGWVGRTFPGFFVLGNSVVASVSLPHWSVAAQRHIYQHAVIAVNNQPVATSAEIYQAVQRLPSGSAITYTLSKDGTVVRVTLNSQTFALKDYVLLFGAYLFTGLVVAGIGVGVWFLKPEAPASRALLSFGVIIGVFFLTANDLYSPHWFFRLHIFSEALMPAAFVHLAVVFPTGFLRSRSLLLCTPYGLSLLLSVFHEVFLYQPDTYSMLHSLCELYAGLSGLPFLIGIVWDSLTTTSPLVRRRIRIVALGFFGAFALPAGLTVFSGLTGGGISVNYSVFTMSLFPLSLGYAIAKHDLFEIDTMVKRGVYYLSLTAVLSLSYFALLAILNLLLRSSEVARSPLFPLLFTLGAVFLLNPLRDYLQQWIDRIFFRLRYDPEKVLETTSTFLASTLALSDILTFVWHTIRETLGVQRGGIFLRATDKTHYVPIPVSRAPTARVLSVEHPLIQAMLQRRSIFSWYDLATEPFSPPSQNQQEYQDTLSLMGAQLIVPLYLKGELLGFILLEAKESGVFFTANDIDLLRTLANQSTLSIANALAYQEIQGLNTELQGSIAQLEKAYRDLQRSQEHLVRSEKMADLGRLTAGIAHEMNTPLGASLASYKMMLDLIDEYKKSIGDPEVNVADHHEIAAEMENLVHNTQQWTERAVAYIRSLKLQTRDVKQGEEREFSLLQSIEDTKLLLSHRLRNSRCTVTIACSAAAPTLRGDPSKFGQVLTNLIGNAMDAYKDTGRDGGEIRITITEDIGNVELRVRDYGCGIPQENLEKIFDDLFTTKPLGEGTGLGLPISRDIVTKFFHGTMRVESIVGQGTTFILRFPRNAEDTKDWDTTKQKAV